MQHLRPVRGGIFGGMPELLMQIIAYKSMFYPMYSYSLGTQIHQSHRKVALVYLRPQVGFKHRSSSCGVDHRRAPTAGGWR